jgi:hypothetical protein
VRFLSEIREELSDYLQDVDEFTVMLKDDTPRVLFDFAHLGEFIGPEE